MSLDANLESPEFREHGVVEITDLSGRVILDRKPDVEFHGRVGEPHQGGFDEETGDHLILEAAEPGTSAIAVLLRDEDGVIQGRRLDLLDDYAQQAERFGLLDLDPPVVLPRVGASAIGGEATRAMSSLPIAPWFDRAVPASGRFRAAGHSAGRSWNRFPLQERQNLIAES